MKTISGLWRLSGTSTDEVLRSPASPPGWSDFSTKKGRMMNMRIILLRVLIASWMIPLSWVVMLPLFALLAGWEIGISDTIDFNYFLWNGM